MLEISIDRRPNAANDSVVDLKRKATHHDKLRRVHLPFGHIATFSPFQLGIRRRL